MLVFGTGFALFNARRWAFRPFFICGAGTAMQLAELIEQVVDGMGYELVDFESSPRARLLRIFIDRSNGVTIDDCSAVSHQLTNVFAVENVDYDRLEVSSPGLDRILKKLSDFERFSGQEIQLRTRLPIDGQRNFKGMLIGVKENTLHLKSDDASYEIPIDQIDKARLVPVY